MLVRTDAIVVLALGPEGLRAECGIGQAVRLTGTVGPLHTETDDGRPAHHRKPWMFLASTVLLAAAAIVAVVLFLHLY